MALNHYKICKAARIELGSLLTLPINHFMSSTRALNDGDTLMRTILWARLIIIVGSGAGTPPEVSTMKLNVITSLTFDPTGGSVVQTPSGSGKNIVNRAWMSPKLAPSPSLPAEYTMYYETVTEGVDCQGQRKDTLGSGPPSVNLALYVDDSTGSMYDPSYTARDISLMFQLVTFWATSHPVP